MTRQFAQLGRLPLTGLLHLSTIAGESCCRGILRTDDADGRHNVRQQVGRLIIASSVLFLAGCFEAVYEERLKTANKYFEHQEVLDANLGLTWYGNGIQIRLPVEFELIPAPQPPAEGEENDQAASSSIDRRQPDFIPMELPGLVSAWKGTVSVDGQSASAYAYLMTNQELLAIPPGPDRPNPSEFTNKTLEDLARAAKLTLKTESWRNESFPPNAGFVTPVSYKSADVDSSREVAGKKMRYKIYQHQAGDIQIIMMFVIPASASGPIIDKIPYALETLLVQAGGGGGSSTAAPAAAAPGSGL